jgi:hypothetical protein
MPRGGRRSGAGRKKGSKDSKPRVRRFFAMPPKGALARDIASAIVDRRLGQLESDVFENGSVANRLEFVKMMLGFSWGVPRAAVDLRVEQAETPERILRELAARHDAAEIVAVESRPLLPAASAPAEPGPQSEEPSPPAHGRDETYPSEPAPTPFYADTIRRNLGTLGVAGYNR